MRRSEKNGDQPLFPIGIVADMLGVTQATLRIWERKDLIKPQRIGKNRYYSYNNLDLLKEIKHLLQVKRLNIAGAQNYLSQERCWDLKKCGDEKLKCSVYLALAEKYE